MPVMVMALETLAGEEYGDFLLQGFARDDSWAWTVGSPLYVSATPAGGLTHVVATITGNQVQIAGRATHADRIYFNPSPVIVEIA
jgi:hypothetical protein